MNEKEIIQNRQDQIRESFGDADKLREYLFQTMDNFYYRYIETSLNQGLETVALGERLWGAVSEENSMVDALKIKNPIAKKGIIELAKFTPKEQGPKVRYTLCANVANLKSESGTIEFRAEINWGFPDFQDISMLQNRTVKFKYEDVAHFRKELALNLEEVCDLFI